MEELPIHESALEEAKKGYEELLTNLYRGEALGLAHGFGNLADSLLCDCRYDAGRHIVLIA